MLLKKIIQVIILYWVLLPYEGVAQDKKHNGAFKQSYRDSLVKAFQQEKNITQSIKLIRLANAYLRGGKLNFTESYEVLHEFLKEVSQRKNVKLLPYIYNALGMIHSTSPEGKLIASDYLMRSTEHIKALNDKEWLGETYRVLGALSYNIGDFVTALQYAHKAEEYIDYNAFKNGEIISIYNTYALMYYKIGDIDSAKIYYNKALKQANPQKDTIWISLLKGNIGTMLYKQKKYDEALPLLQEDVKISINNKMYDNAILSVCDIIGLYIEKKELENARKIIEQSSLWLQKVVKTPVSMQIYAKYYAVKAEYYEQIDAHKEALHYNKLFQDADAQYRKHLKDIELQNIRFRYNYETKQQDVDKLTKQNESQLMYLYMVSFGLVIIVLVVVIIGQRYYQKNVLANKLTIQNEQIKQINEELLQSVEQISAQSVIIDQQNTELQASNASKDKIFTLISHDLRSPLASVKGIITLLANNLLSIEELQSILPTITSNIDHTLNLSEELLYWATSQMQGIETNLASVNPKYIASQTFLIFTENAQKKNIHLIENISVKIPNVWADENMSKTILRNLVANALKFCEEGGTISIMATQQDENFIKFGVKDTGIGIKAENLPKIFSNEPFTTKGTAGEKGTGFGLMLCKDFVTQNGGKIWVESEWEKGTTFFFTLPIDKNRQAS